VSRDHATTDEKLYDIGAYATSPHYDERERAALEYADEMTLSDRDVDDALFARVSGHYSPEEIVELTGTVALENFLSKFHRTLRVESQGFCRLVVPLATQPGQRPASP
jgi:alkylhydroperoxidase family enzyme